MTARERHDALGRIEWQRFLGEMWKVGEQLRLNDEELRELTPPAPEEGPQMLEEQERLSKAVMDFCWRLTLSGKVRSHGQAVQREHWPEGN